MKDIFQTGHFKKDFKRAKKRGKDLGKLKELVRLIAEGEALEERHCDQCARHGLLPAAQMAPRPKGRSLVRDFGP